jgi:hypothetical protein
MQVGDLVKTQIQDVDFEAGMVSIPVCTLGVIVDKEEILECPTNPILTVRLFLKGQVANYTNVYFQSDLEVVSNG